MELKNLSNDQLFPLYFGDLALRITNGKNLKCIRALLNSFKDFLGEYPPSAELAKGFLAKYTGLSSHTWYNYVGELKRFMAWYGEPLKLKVKLPQTLPPYIEPDIIVKLLHATEHNKTHPESIMRDAVLVILAIKTGLRRAELANLEKQDIHDTFLVVKQGKGKKDRSVPLSKKTVVLLHKFIKDMPPTQKIFGLNATSLGMKIKALAKKAGLSDFHCHSLRHFFSISLLESGANVKQVQSLLGQANLATTQVYLAVNDKSLTDAIDLLDGHSGKSESKVPLSSGVIIVSKTELE